MTFLSNHAVYHGGAIEAVSTFLTEDIHVRTIHTLDQICFIQLPATAAGLPAVSWVCYGST